MPSFQHWRPKRKARGADPISFQLDPKDEPDETRRKILSYLREHRRYYVEGNERYQRLWNWLNISAVCLSFAGSILVALSFTQDSVFFKFMAVVLPAAAGFCSTILIQFRIREMWQLRDNGRIEVEDLICQAHMVGITKPENAYGEAIKLRQQAHDLERRQSARFFSFLEPAVYDEGSRRGNRVDANNGGLSGEMTE